MIVINENPIINKTNITKTISVNSLFVINNQLAITSSTQLAITSSTSSARMPLFNNSIKTDNNTNSSNMFQTSNEYLNTVPIILPLFNSWMIFFAVFAVVIFLLVILAFVIYCLTNFKSLNSDIKETTKKATDQVEVSQDLDNEANEIISNDESFGQEVLAFITPPSSNSSPPRLRDVNELLNQRYSYPTNKRKESMCCTIEKCDFILNSNNFADHIKRHGSDKYPFQCPLCSYGLLNKENDLKEHSLNSHKEIFSLFVEII